jgi:hypothetical protein
LNLLQVVPEFQLLLPGPGLTAPWLQVISILVDEATGAMQAVGNPIPLQINAFGMNNDGFLYGMQASSNVVNPFLTRVDKNGAYQNLGTILPPATGAFEVRALSIPQQVQQTTRTTIFLLRL